MAGNIKVEGIELEVKTNAGQAAAQVDKLASATRSLSAASSSAEKPTRELSRGLGKTAENAAQAKEATSSSAKEFKKLDTAAKSAASNGLSKIAAAFKRILFYRIVRSAIKEVTQAFAEGVNNAYAYSKAISGPLAKNMDALATSFLYLKNGLGAGLAPIINALTPIITTLADAIANLGNTIAGFIAALTGQSTFIKAIKNMTNYADATKGAAKAQRQLLGFDELNVLTAKSGSGGSSLNYNKMFETVDTSTFKENLSKSLTEIPALVSKKLKDGLNSLSEKISEVNWLELPGKIAEKIQVAFENFDFPGVFSAIGKFIGAALAAAISFTTGTLYAAFKDYIDEELGNLNEDATLLEIGGAVVKGLWNGIEAVAKNYSMTAWADENISKPLLQGLRSGIVDGIFNQLPLEVRWKVATKWAEFKHWWKDLMGSEEIMSFEWWKEQFKPIWEAFGTVLDWIKTRWQNFKEWFNNNKLNIKAVINGSDKYGAGGFGGSVSAWAEGGYPAAGSMFLAGEAGPELVSQVGGRTGVINNDTFGAIVSTAAENIINAVLASGQATAEAARAGGNVYLDKTLVSRALYGSMQSEGTRKGGSAVQFVGV